MRDERKFGWRDLRSTSVHEAELLKYERSEQTRPGIERRESQTNLLGEVEIDRVSESLMAVRVRMEKVASLEDVVGSVLVHLRENEEQIESDQDKREEGKGGKRT